MRVCVTESPRRWVGGVDNTQNRNTAACVNRNTRGRCGSSVSNTTTVCIQYNYIQQTKGRKNTLCLHYDYNRGVVV